MLGGSTRCKHPGQPNRTSPDQEETAEIVDERGENQQDDEQRIRPPVEQVTAQGEDEVSGPTGRRVIETDRRRQEIEKEDVRAEHHE